MRLRLAHEMQKFPGRGRGRRGPKRQRTNGSVFSQRLQVTRELCFFAFSKKRYVFSFDFLCTWEGNVQNTKIDTFSQDLKKRLGFGPQDGALIFLLVSHWLNVLVLQNWLRCSFRARKTWSSISLAKRHPRATGSPKAEDEKNERNLREPSHASIAYVMSTKRRTLCPSVAGPSKCIAVVNEVISA